MGLSPEVKLCSFLDSCGALERTTILVAVSGGADSVSLLAMLHRLAGRYGYALRAVTVDHRIRSEAESGGDALFVKKLCSEFDPPVPCELVELASGEVAILAAKRGRGIEDAARHLRYRAIERVADRLSGDIRAGSGGSETGGVIVMTAHNRNDRNETMLMRFLQGASGRSLAGIAGVRGRLVRPLLDCTHAELCAYLESRGIGWREDATNADGAYLRNRIRHSLVPLLDREFPGWETGVRAGAEKASLDEDLARSAVAASGAAWLREPDGSIRCDARRYFSLHPAARLRFLRDGLELLAESLSAAPDAASDARGSPASRPGRVAGGYLLSLAKLSGGQPEATHPAVPAPPRVFSGSGLSFAIRGDSVFWGPDIVQNTKSGYLVCICLAGTYHLPFGELTVEGDGNRVFLDGRFGPFSLPLIIRSRTGGDAVRMADGGQKTLKKLMNDWSVPEHVRNLVPLIEQDGEIRAVYGSPLGFPDWYVRR